MRPFSRRPGLRVILAGSFVWAAVWVPAPASAQQVFADANPCAIFGSGYVVVTGGEGCARIGERVRVEAGAGPRAVSAAPQRTLGYAPHMTGSIGPYATGPAHVRAPGPAGAGADWPRTR